ncbi:MAG: 30S ribosomal protein S17 [Candidatus Alcyoniella australis]|nr:30S ribosomal protein S17 [Candidatus Alcyoniella australis]
MNSQRGKRKTIVGVVTSDKMDKTVVVQTSRLTKHALYGKYVRRRKKVKAHDETNTCRVGDRVSLIESRPLSKDKRWRVSSVIERAQ